MDMVIALLLMSTVQSTQAELCSQEDISACESYLDGISIDGSSNGMFTNVSYFLSSCPAIQAARTDYGNCVELRSERCYTYTGMTEELRHQTLEFTAVICDRYFQYASQCSDADTTISNAQECARPQLLNINEDVAMETLCRQITDAAIGCATVTSQCPLVMEVSQVQLQNIVQMYFDFLGCTVTIGDNTYSSADTGCSVITTLQCFNPFIAALDDHLNMHNFSQSMSIAELRSQVNAITQFLQINTNWPDICSTPIRAVDWDEIFGCYQSCLVWFNRNIKNIAAGNNAAIVNLLEILNTMDRHAALFDNLCDPGCETIGMLRHNYETCVGDLSIVVPPLTSSQQNQYSDCRNVSVVAECERNNRLQCDYLAVQAHLQYTHPVYHEYFSSCTEEDLRTPPQPLLCKYEGFRDITSSFYNCEVYLESISSRPVTSGGLCMALQSEVSCYVNSIQCCEQRLSLLQPRLHRYAFFNQLLHCEIEMESDQSNLANVLVASTDRNCDYSHLLGCYAPLFSVLAVTSVTPSDTDLLEKLALLTSLHQPSRQYCRELRSIDFHAISECRRTVLASCHHPSTCVFRQAVVDHPQPLDVIDLAYVEQVTRSTCSDECRDAEKHTKCNYMELSLLSQQISWDYMTQEGTYASKCGKLQDIAQCMKNKIGNCQAYISDAAIALVRAISGTGFIRALSICGENYFSPIVEFELDDIAQDVSTDRTVSTEEPTVTPQVEETTISQSSWPAINSNISMSLIVIMLSCMFDRLRGN